MGQCKVKMNYKIQQLDPIYRVIQQINNFITYCGYQFDKAVTKIPVKWSLQWNDIISLHAFELSNQIDCNNYKNYLLIINNYHYRLINYYYYQLLSLIIIVTN